MNLNDLENKFFGRILNAELDVPVHSTLEYGENTFGIIVVPEISSKPTFPIWLKSFLSNSSMVFQPLSNYGPFLRVPSYNNSMICHFAVRCRRHHGGT